MRKVSSRSRVNLGVALLALGLILDSNSGASAANPHITLQLQNVPADKALAALSKASGVSMQFEAYPPAPTTLVSFDWKNVALSQAMREYSERLRVHFYHFRFEEGYRVSQRDYQPPAQPAPIAWEGKGARISVLSVSLGADRRERLDTGFTQDGGGFGLRLLVELPNQDASLISEITNISAKDDLGNIWVSPGGPSSQVGVDLYPDQWSGQITFFGLDPQIHKLLWLEGELERRDVFPEEVINIPLPLANKATHYEANSLKLDLQKVQIPSSGAGEQPEVDLQILSPPLDLGRVPFRPLPTFDGIKVALIGASGKVYDARFGTVSREGAQGHIHAVWSSLPETITWLRVRSKERGDPQRLMSFRLRDIPLPTTDSFVPLQPDREDGEAKPAEHAFFVPMGGSISGSVRIAGAKDPAGLKGAVSYGLAPVLAGEIGATEWMKATLAADGNAKLEHLRPGKYRVLRVYRTKEPPPAFPTPGRWLNTETAVEIRAGMGTALPPLEWSRERPPVAPAGR